MFTFPPEILEKCWREEVAVHEAGHAVVAATLGMDVVEVSAYPAINGNVGATGLDLQGHTLTEAADGMRSIMMILAGPAAQLMLNAEAEWDGWSNDFREVGAQLRSLDLTWRHLLTLWRRADRIVTKHCQIIFDVAERLVRNEPVNGEVISEMFLARDQAPILTMKEGRLRTMRSSPCLGEPPILSLPVRGSSLLRQRDRLPHQVISAWLREWDR